MNIQDISFTLRDGRSAIIRSPREEDAQALIDYLKVSSGETEFILRYPEECGVYTLENEKAIIQEWSESPNEITMVCSVDGEIAGNCNLSFNTRLKTRHRASVAIALMRKFWNLGIGTRMFEEMIRLASLKPDVTQMELEFIEGNSRARHLYEKMGFRIVGLHPNAIRLKDGSYRNEYLMIRQVE